MDRDTLIFIAFCVFILLLGVRFWQQLRERTERTEADRSIADEAVPLPAKSRRRYLYSDSGDCVRRFTDLYAFLVNP